MNSDSVSGRDPVENLPLEQQVARLQALLEATRHVHSTIQAEKVLEQATRILVRELEMAGALFLLPGSGEPHASYGDVPEAPYEGCLRYPLLSREQIPLAELVVAPEAGSEASLYDQDFIEGLVLQTAVALENATLHERDVEWARVQQDLDAARSIQRSLLPKAMPEIAGFSIAGRSTACYEVGGDYLDAMALPDGSYLLVVADVAGKGLASAIVATSFRAALRSLASQPISMAELAARMGQQHWEEGQEARRRYVTALLLRLLPETREVEVVNAGHNPAALFRPDGSVQMIEASGTPLGMLPGMHYLSETHALPPGSRIFVYTDGLTEAVSEDEEEFGLERLLSALGCIPHPYAEPILDSIWTTLGEFSGNAPQTDDMTALAICHLDSSQQEIGKP